MAHRAQILYQDASIRYNNSRKEGMRSEYLSAQLGDNLFFKGYTYMRMTHTEKTQLDK